MKKSTLLLNNINLRPSQIHKFRGFVGNEFKEHDLIHNHDEKGNPIYRYPLIQFKLIEKTPAIIAITDKAVNIFAEIFMKLDKIIIEDTVIPVYEKDLKVEEVEFGYSDEIFMYEFASPWIGLNQKNFKKYNDAGNDEKNEILKKVMTGNILSMAKYLDSWLSQDQKIKIAHKLKEIKVNLKGKSMTAFTGIFKTNFCLPDYLGIGKSVSRGFGTVKVMI
ncbi:CRISPR-associated endonuclease Cas6 [Desulfosarcina sp. BuS5]|uniref:CRISPR-associated endonuclease Cas6 n=1 Tax=Desulfosarcina sp. BuS5 TaxID=933262 RepID=UPI00048372E2|nr:CRISPR-associated endonuclease Cas6 [Desulfosarcina sp. BuS5]